MYWTLSCCVARSASTPSCLADADRALLAQLDQALVVDLVDPPLRPPFVRLSRGSSSAFASRQSAIAVMSATALSELPSSLSTVSWTEW